MLLPVNLVLEGGALRGIFTAGVLDALDEKDHLCEFVIGVSAGACMGVSYITRQRGRSCKITLTYCRDHRYFSWRNLLREGNIFGVKFTYEDIPRRLIPFDYKAFEQSPQRFIAVATDCATGQAVYLENDTPERKKDMVQEIRASSSMPFFSRPVPIGNRLLLDGGVSDSIPVEYAMNHGYAKSIVVLTRPKGYTKKASGFPLLYHALVPGMPELAGAMSRRAENYNHSLALAEKLEAEGKCLLIYPPADIKVDRLERDRAKLEALYQAGYRAGLDCGEKIPVFL